MRGEKADFQEWKDRTIELDPWNLVNSTTSDTTSDSDPDIDPDPPRPPGNRRARPPPLDNAVNECTNYNLRG